MHDYSARQCSSLSSHQNGAIWCWSAASLSLCCHHIYHHPPRKQTGRTNSPSRCSSTSPQHLTSKLICATPTDADTRTLSGNLYFNLYPSTGLKLMQRRDRFCYSYKISFGIQKVFVCLFLKLIFSPIPSWWHADWAVKLGMWQKWWVIFLARIQYNSCTIFVLHCFCLTKVVKVSLTSLSPNIIYNCGINKNIYFSQLIHIISCSTRHILLNSFSCDLIHFSLEGEKLSTSADDTQRLHHHASGHL